MPTLDSHASTMEVVRKFHIQTKKKYGQNFLTDSSVLSGIVDAAGVTKDDCVLEIGPGIGTLTQYLAEAAGHVVSVEIDGSLLPVLDETLAEYDNVTIIHEDVLKVDLKAVAEEYHGGKPLKVIANLPYYITTPILLKLFESGMPFYSITVMVQDEVARRMEAGPGNKDYGTLSLAVQYYAEPQIMLEVPPASFIPPPGVDSAVIRLTKHEQPPVEVADEAHFFRVLRAAFAQRRKTLCNSLSSDPVLGLSRDRIAAALGEMGLSADIRGEKLTLEQFAELDGILSR